MIRFLSLCTLCIVGIVSVSSCSEQPDDVTNIEQDSVEMSRYVIAIKREKRDEMSRDWAQQVASIPGVQVEPSSSSRRMMIHATESGIGMLREKLGEGLHIEVIVEHQKND